MNVNNPFLKEKKRKLSNEEESLGKNSKTKNEDIKPNLNMIFKTIKKEPEFMVADIKKELDFEVREIKKEPYQSDKELVTPHFTELPPKSKRKKQKATKTNKRLRKTNAKAKRRTSKRYKKSTQTKKTKRCKKSVIPKKSTSRKKIKTKKKSRKKSRSVSKSAKSTKKGPNTLLDRQNNGNLSLFGFRDELEYFSLESDHKEFEEISSGRNITGKRTRLSSLDARKKVILTLKSTPMYPSSNPKPIIQHSKGENIDLLGSILESQTLWHSKSSHMKVNEDGSVEVIDRKNKKLMETELTIDKKSNLHRNETNGMISTQARNDPAHTSPVGLNLNENIETHLTTINIKTEACDTETWDTEMVFDENKPQTCEEKIKVGGKEEKTDLPKSLPSVPFLQESPSVSELTFANSPKTEKSDDEVDDCPIFSIYSKASKIFSLQREKERELRFMSDQLDIQLMEMKENEKVEGKEEPSKRHKNYQEKEKVEKLDRAKKRGQSPSPKRKREENKEAKNPTCFIVK